MQVIGYQMVKMGDTASAISLLEQNAKTYAASSGAAFGLGRAYQTAGRLRDARTEFTRALTLDPTNERAKTALRSLSEPQP